MSRIANSARPAASSFGVGRFAGRPHLEVDAGVAIEALCLGGVDAAVDRVGAEIEHERRAFRRARFCTVPAAAGETGEREDGRQQRDSPSHAARNLFH
jgi:hypothetical protein